MYRFSAPSMTLTVSGSTSLYIDGHILFQKQIRICVEEGCEDICKTLSDKSSLVACCFYHKDNVYSLTYFVYGHNIMICNIRSDISYFSHEITF